jgi:hypothetical protein
MSPEQTRAWPLDARSDLFSVGTVLYLLTTGKKPFDGATDVDVLMQVRRAKPEKPSSLVKDLNPDVERFINRALRADPAKRWQSAEQMADRIDTILVKLGQPSGPAPLKRWLETLGERDGAKPPAADNAAATDPSIAVELGSLDLELQEVAQTIVEEDPGAVVDTHPERARVRPAPARPDPAGRSLPTRPDPRGAQLAKADRLDVLAGEALTTPGAIVRARRWLLRMTIRAALILVAVGGAFYFALPHLPAWAKRPVDNWMRRLPAPLRPHESPSPGQPAP